MRDSINHSPDSRLTTGHNLFLGFIIHISSIKPASGPLLKLFGTSGGHARLQINTATANAEPSCS